MPGTSILKPFQSIGAASALVLMTGFSLAHLPGQRSAAPAFKSAHVVSATDVPYPKQSIAIGTVVLEVTISETGQVENVLPIREIDSLTEVATDSVKNWQFTSASLDGKPMRSRTTVGHALVQLKSNSGYDVYYSLVVGVRKGRTSPITSPWSGGLGMTAAG